MFHATPKHNLDSIMDRGIEARNNLKQTNAADRIEASGVYLFSDEYDAYSFASDNWDADEFVILRISTGNYQADLIPDPEYDAGVAWFLPGSIHPADVEIVEE